jgi:hypothetical protein
MSLHTGGQKHNTSSSGCDGCPLSETHAVAVTHAVWLPSLLVAAGYSNEHGQSQRQKGAKCATAISSHSAGSNGDAKATQGKRGAKCATAISSHSAGSNGDAKATQGKRRKTQLLHFSCSVHSLVAKSARRSWMFQIEMEKKARATMCSTTAHNSATANKEAQGRKLKVTN